MPLELHGVTPGSVAVARDEALVIGATREADGEREEPCLIRVPLQSLGRDIRE
ncbi:MAG TPA: hypothetical protein VF432_10025 [Thermoanaerobaculia bacterium]